MERLGRFFRRDAAIGPGGVLATVLMLGGAMTLRLMLQPLLHSGYPFATFYAPVAFSAYWWGRRVGGAAVAGGLILGSIVMLLSPPAGSAPVAAPIFFATNAAMIVLVVGGVPPGRDRREVADAEAQAAEFGALFQTLAERVGDHLKMVEGVLALQAKGETNSQVAEALRRAAVRSALIAKDRARAAGPAPSIDFQAFAARLVEGALARAQLPPDRVQVAPFKLQLEVDRATSLGVALLECVDGLAAVGLTAPVRINVEEAAGRIVLRLENVERAAGALVITRTSGFLLRAMVEHLGARLWITTTSAGAALEVAFPRRPDPTQSSPRQVSRD